MMTKGPLYTTKAKPDKGFPRHTTNAEPDPKWITLGTTAYNATAICKARVSPTLRNALPSGHLNSIKIRLIDELSLHNSINRILSAPWAPRGPQPLSLSR